jgi:hypothetical protein
MVSPLLPPVLLCSAWPPACLPASNQTSALPLRHRLEPWLAIALFLLHERAKGGASRWAAYLAALPADSGSPVQWEEADLAELAGSQLLGTVQGYRCVLRRFMALC